MKFYSRVFLSITLLFFLFSCSLMTRGKGFVAQEGPFASTGRRRGLYKVKVEAKEMAKEEAKEEAKEGAKEAAEKVEGRRAASEDLAAKENTPPGQREQSSGSEPVSITSELAKVPAKDDKSRTVFKPYVPQDKPQSQVEPLPDEIPSDVKEQIIFTGEVGGEEYVTLNFQQAPIEDIINTVSEALGLNYILSNGVKGQITMETAKPVPVSELFQILQSVLEVNGFTLVLSGRYFKVIQAKEAIHYPLEVMSGKAEGELPEEETYITQIVPLEFIPVKDMVKVLQPFLSKSAPAPLQHDELNLLILNDTASNTKRLLKFVQELDKPIYEPKEKVFVYYVENGDAKKLEETLNSIYKKKSASERDRKKVPNQPNQPNQPGQPQTPPQGVPPMPLSPFFNPFWGAGEEVEGEVTIVGVEDINALIITTSPRNYPAVLETIKKLDIQPRQALIEVLIAEITIDDIRDFGLDWQLKGGASSGFGYSLNQQLKGLAGDAVQTGEVSFGEGINYVLNKQNQFMALLNTKADQDKLNILSSPHIMASDNQKASIEITQDYPIANKTTNAATGNEDINYTYKNAGIKLSFTPKINEKGLVSLELIQEVSNLMGDSDMEAGKYIFNTRKAETTVVVHDSETLIIGGLVKEQKSKSRDGIPFLGEIPLLGYLFSHTKDEIHKTELIILITPHVIHNEDEGKVLTKQFQDRVKSLKTRIKQDTQAKQKMR